ncbi:MAG: [protein-PII] uridylyltransferase [Opitutales bacterium]
MLTLIRKHARSRFRFNSGTSSEDRLAAYRQFLRLENEMIYRRHRAGESGLKIAQARSTAIDLLLRDLFSRAIKKYEKEQGPPPAQVCMLAIGGYGRKELSPLSDIDIMFLFSADSQSAKGKAFEENLANEILYPLWDLNLKIGYSIRTVRDAIQEARKEVQTKTSLLEARRITGPEELFRLFENVYRNFYRNDHARTYLKNRLQDQAERRERYGGTIFLQEPNVKNGVGGIRDYQNSLWMARVKLDVDRIEDLCKHDYLRKKEQREYLQAYDFLLRVRNDLHFMSKRPTDILNLENQPMVAENLGYTQEDIFERVEAFMRDYYRHAQTIYNISKILEERLALRKSTEESDKISFREVVNARRLDRQKEFDGFLLRGRELSYESRSVFRKDPERLIRVFRHCQQLNCRMDFELSSLIQESLHLISSKVIHSSRAHLSFRTILEEAGQVHPTLSLMHQLGVLGKFIPEFGRLTCLVQHEYYHRYTADIHTLNTIRELDAVFVGEDPITHKYREALRQTTHPTLLYLILFLHDIGKSVGNAGHAEAGAKMATHILERMELEPGKEELVEFIIKNHLLMARIWQKYDVDDLRTAGSFAQQVESLEKLHTLYVHTFCDARGTAASLWNSYKDALHTTLYQNTCERLTLGDKVEDHHLERKKMTYQETLARKLPDISEEEISAHYNLLPERYFIQTEPDQIALHIQLINKLLTNIMEKEGEATLRPIIDWKNDIDRSLTIVNVVTWDRAGLFSKLAGAFSVAGLSILTARAVSRSDHIAIDTFYVVERNRGLVQSQTTRDLFGKSLERALNSNEDLLPEILANNQKSSILPSAEEKTLLGTSFPPTVHVYHELSLKRTIIEIQANDQIGLLYQISRTIFDFGYNITFARIATERGVAIDTFYIEPTEESGPGERTDLLDLQNALLGIVSPEEKESAPPAKPQ